MAVPNFYSTDFIYRTITGVVDVQDWIDEIIDILTVALPVASRWTAVTPGSVYESPVDPQTGYFMRLTLARVTALRMGFLIQDQNLSTVFSGEADISGTGDAIKTSAGPKNLFTWTVAGEYALATMVDPAPEAPNAPTTVVYVKTTRDSAGNPIGFGNFPERWWAIDGWVAALFARLNGPYFPQNSQTYEIYTAGGSIIYIPPACIAYASPGGAPRFTGYAYQLTWLDQFLGGRVPVPIDVGVIGYFEKIAGLGTQGVGFSQQVGMLAARVA